MAAGPIAEPTRPYLGPGASPEVIAAGLRPEDREPFDRTYRAALPADDGDGDGARAAIDRWRGIALMQSDPELPRATGARHDGWVDRRIAARNTRRPVPTDEPLMVTRRAAGM